ncbi:MAG: hypothetical protein IKU19_06510 [Clostridia bacterium]|nr:hypothetical protein [Clostridia bacterium]
MLTLKIVSKEGVSTPVECDSVHLKVCDNTLGQGGGSMGIRPGHIKSLISVERGPVVAYLDGKEIFSLDTDGGFATVENDNVTIVTEKITKR